MLHPNPPIAQALDKAQLLWPDVPRGKVLLVKLVTLGADTLVDQRQSRLEALDALIEVSSAEGAYPPGYLDDLRQEWPA